MDASFWVVTKSVLTKDITLWLYVEPEEFGMITTCLEHNMTMNDSPIQLRLLSCGSGV